MLCTIGMNMYVEGIQPGLREPHHYPDRSVRSERGNVAFPSAPAAGTDRRQTSRRTISRSARLRIANCRVAVETIDISRGGAKVSLCSEADGAAATKDLVRGMIILLTINSLEPQLCEVRWRSGSMAGVRFLAALPIDALDLLNPSPSPAGEPWAGNDS